MTYPTENLLRDAEALRNAKEQYERAATLHFTVEDVLRGDPDQRSRVKRRHVAGVIAAHAAWAELVDPEPR